jgi:hypothetical protein
LRPYEILDSSRDIKRIFLSGMQRNAIILALRLLAMLCQKQADFPPPSPQKTIEHNMCAFNFSTKLSEEILILRQI